MGAKLEARLTLPVMTDVPDPAAHVLGHIHCTYRETTMSRYRIRFLRGEVAISSKDARYLEERDGEVVALMIGGHCFSWWSNDQLRRRAARKEKARIEQEERWARATL